MIMMCLLAMMVASLSAKAQEVTITLFPGWNWISCPMMDTLDFATAMGTFTPMTGDRITSQWGFASYSGGQWHGNISQFYPGYGYHYKSNRTMPVTVTFTAQQPAPQIIVTTMEPTDITAISAMSGGSLSSTDGSYIVVLEKGICWATHPNPTVMNDFHTENGSGSENFTSDMTDLISNMVYYVRAYAVTPNGTTYGNEVSFTTLDDGSNYHEYVDLGLPSGTLWATCNVGADAPEEYGDNFAWGETQPKSTYNWSTYQYCNGSSNTLTKYCTNSSFGYNGFTDALTVLLPEDDAASANWGSNWRMPSKTEWDELFENTTGTGFIQNGVNGVLFTASNGNSLFLPTAGLWSSTLYPSPDMARLFSISSSGSYGNNSAVSRCVGRSVRAVRCKNSVIDVTANSTEGGSVSGGGTYLDHTNCTVSATTNEGYCFVNWTENRKVVSTEANYSFIVNGNRHLVANFMVCGSDDHDYVDLGLPSGILWATCNVGAYNPDEYGDYFAWGETIPKETYNWNTYQYCMGSYTTMTKYCTNSSYGYNGFIDNLTVLLPEDDAATANWGSDWRMPTKAEWQELYNNTTCTWTTQNGVNGRLFTASNGNSLFLPAAGYGYEYILGDDAGGGGYYWSSSLDLDINRPFSAWFFTVFSSGYYMDRSYMRYYGRSVRAVRSVPQN
jgi:hypothetical protein